MKSARIVVVVLAVILVFLLRGTTISLADSTTPSQTSILSSDTESDVPQNLHTQVQSVMIETVSAFICQLTGIDVVDPKHGCLGINTQTGKIGYAPRQDNIGRGGALGFVDTLIASTFEIPVSTHEYISYLSSNFGIGKKAYAQISTIQPGIGLQGLAPIFRIWEAFRNIVYFIFVIVLVLVGIGIMFRIQIDPRTVMTIQNQIPKIIIGLVLVSLSYAIAGLLIDFMWVIIYILFSIFAVMKPELGGLLSSLYDTPYGFANALPVTVPVNISLFNNPVLNTTISIGGILGIAINGASAMGSAIGTTLRGALQSSTIGLLISIPLAVLNAPGLIGCLFQIQPGGALGFLPQFPGIQNAGNCFTTNAAQGVDNIGFLIAFLILLIAIVFSLFRLWFQLLKSYVFILLDVIFAPFWIVFGLLPGSSMSFGSWLRDIAANMLVFPAAVLMFLLAYVIMTSFTDSTGTFVPPLVGNPFGSSTVIASIIGVGIILMTPEVTSMVRGALKSPGFGHIGSIGTMTGIGGAFVGSTAGGVWNKMWAVNAYGQPVGPLAAKVGRALKQAPNSITGRIARPFAWAMGMRRSEIDKPGSAAYDYKAAEERENQSRQAADAQRAQERADLAQQIADRVKGSGGTSGSSGSGGSTPPTGGGTTPPP